MSQPKKKFKALIVDCDGTLIESKRDALPTTEVINAVRKAAKILHVGIATQRSLFDVRPILERLNLSGPSIISGGAQVIDSKTLKVLREELIKREDILKMIKIIKEFKKKNVLKFYIQDTDGEEDKEFTDTHIPKKPIEAAVFTLESQVADELRDKLSRETNLSVHKVASWRQGWFGVAVTAVLATKQHGIFEVAKLLNINTYEIIGIGDGYNDFPLLLACGLKVAMGNAVDDLKAIADYIAPSVEENGVVDVINKFILA